MWVFCLYVGLPHAHRDQGGHKRVLDPLQVELQIIVSCHVSAGVLLGSSERTAISCVIAGLLKLVPIASFIVANSKQSVYNYWNLEVLEDHFYRLENF